MSAKCCFMQILSKKMSKVSSRNAQPFWFFDTIFWNLNFFHSVRFPRAIFWQFESTLHYVFTWAAVFLVKIIGILNNDFWTNAKLQFLQNSTEASIYNKKTCLQVRLEHTRVKHLSGVPLKGRLLATPTNVRQGCNGLPKTNTSLWQKSVN